MAPRSEALNERLREESRRRIAEEALRLFATHGYERTTVAMVARAAGISAGLIYHYYAGKEALLREVIERSVRDVESSFAAALGAAPAQRVERLVAASFAVVRRNRDFWRLSYALRMQPQVLAAVGGEVLRAARAIEAMLERLLREAGFTEPALEAALLFATIDGVSQHYVLDPDGYPLDEVAGRIVLRYRDRGATHEAEA